MFELPESLEFVWGISSPSIDKQQRLGTPVLQANDSIACQGSKIIENYCFIFMLLKQVRLRVPTLSVLENTAIPNQRVQQPITACLLFMLHRCHMALSLRPPPPLPCHLRAPLCLWTSSLFFLDTPASRGTFTLRMQKWKLRLWRCTLSLKCATPPPAYQSQLFDAPHWTSIAAPAARLKFRLEPFNTGAFPQRLVCELLKFITAFVSSPFHAGSL